MSPTNAICRVLATRLEIGKCPQVPSNRPLQPPKRQGNMTFGQPRKLCLLGGVLPRAIEHRPPRSTLSIFSRSFFSTPCYFRGRPKFRVLGRFVGLCGLVRPHVRARLSRETGQFPAFPLFPASGLTFTDSGCILSHHLWRFLPVRKASNPRERSAVVAHPAA